MSDEKPGADETAEVKLSKKDLEDLLSKAANAALDAAEKKTDPSTRPPAMPSADEGQQAKPPKGYMPAGLEVKSFNINNFPRGEISDNFSVARLARAQSLYKQTGQPISKNAPWEAAYYEGVEKTVSKAQAEAAGQDGGYLAPEEWRNELYSILRSHSVLDRLPIRRLTTSSRLVHIPVTTGDVTVSYAAENATLTDSTLQYSQRTFVPRKQYTFVKVSNELIADSAPSADASIRLEAGRAMAIDRDKQALLGNGQAGAPTGLLNMTNVTTTSLAATPTYANIVTGIQNVRSLNNSTNVPTGQAECTGVVFNIQFEQTVASLLDSNNRPLWEYGLSTIGRVPTPNWLGVPNWIGTNFIPSGNTATIFYGDWQYFILMEREGIEVMSSDVAGTAFAQDQTWIRITYRYDVGCAHPEAFFAHTNAHA